MSLLSRAASSLVQKLEESRDLPRNIPQLGKTKNKNTHDDQELAVYTPPPRPTMSARDEEMELVLKLDVPKYDKTREFHGLIKLKVDRKERHSKAVDNFSSFLDTIAEDLEKELLTLSLKMREDLEQIDENFKSYYKTLDDDDYLIIRNEEELLATRKKSVENVEFRSSVIETYADDLDFLEMKRADFTGTELRKLVDLLVGIAHQLPDEIEHIVENETFDLNNVLTANRQSHAHLLSMLRKMQVKVEAESIQRWENGRKKWRKIRHKKGLNDFHAHICSPEFEDPSDRQVFLKNVRRGQGSRFDSRFEQLNLLSALTADNIKSSSVIAIQGKLGGVSELEMLSIQNCYDGLSELRSSLRIFAQNRVEELRKELHVYGFLEVEPNLTDFARYIQFSLDDPTLAELWRLGGGLKTEFQTISNDLTNDNIMHNTFVDSINDRLILIASSFSVRSILEERGRLPQLERIRNFIVKLRNVPRGEVAAIIRALLPMLSEIIEIETIPAFIKKTVNTCISEMNNEQARVESINQLLLTTRTIERKESTISVSSSSTAQSGSKVKTRGSANGRSATGSMRNMTSGKKTAKSQEENRDTYFDSQCIRTWNRMLGIVFFGSELSPKLQEYCLEGIENLEKKRRCNNMIDELVKENSEKILNRMDSKYKKMIDIIASFLEAQENYFSTCSNNLIEFFLKLSVLVEKHRTLQKNLDEKSADDFWDLSEDFRLDNDDNEVLFVEKCQVLRESAENERLILNFEVVLGVLLNIEESYRVYHNKACFASDKYPLYLIDEFKSYLTDITTIFHINPKNTHPLLISYDSIYDETIRLNKTYFDSDPAAGGVKPREKRDSLPLNPLPLTDTPDDKKDVTTKKDESTTKPKRNSIAAGGEKRKSVAAGADKRKSVQPAPMEVVVEKVIEEEEEIYDSPNIPKVQEDKPVSTRSVGRKCVASNASPVFDHDEREKRENDIKIAVKSFCGQYKVVLPLPDLAVKLTEEQPSVVESVIEESVVQVESFNPSRPTTGKESKRGMSVVLQSEKQHDTHEVYCWLLKTTTVLPLTLAQQAKLQLDPDDWEEYAQALAKSFVTPEEFEMSAILESVEEENREKAAALAILQKQQKDNKVPAKSISTISTMGSMGSVGSMSVGSVGGSEEVNSGEDGIDLEGEGGMMTGQARLDAYQRCEKIFNDHKTTELQLTDPLYLRTHVPTCVSTNQPWILQLEITPQIIEKLISHIRDSLIVSIEIEACGRIENGQALTVIRKAEFTEELEGKLRNHWPRRGRVETEIKQPRDVELASHEEKTWRHIRAIQIKMTEIQKRILREISSAEKICEVYVRDISALKDSLKSQTFKNLASLQVFDVNVRRCTLDFQSVSTGKLNVLGRICDGDVANIVGFAGDFRKICPGQVEGLPGGFSEAELEEIESLVKGQCDEIETVQEEWRGDIAKLRAKQEATTKHQDSFLSEYENVSLELILSEGLGQKYGGPRRKAQEKLRTTVSRDEQSAGKIDETLALLEFQTLEEGRRNNQDLEPDSGNNGANLLSLLNSTWALLLSVRQAIKERVDFLEVKDVEKEIVFSKLVWIENKEKKQDIERKMDSLSVDQKPGNVGSSPAVVPTLTEVFAEVEQSCRNETIELYTAEGKTSLLTNTVSGVPESLKHWLEESKVKIFGVKGHREKAWKRLWDQTGRLEVIFARRQLDDMENGGQDPDPTNPNENENENNLKSNTGISVQDPSIGAPVACIRLLTDSHQIAIRNKMSAKEKEFEVLMVVWEKGREKHERLLRPRLGSSDCAEELSQLDKIEKERSSDLISNLIKYRKVLLRALFEGARGFIEEIVTCTKGLMNCIDSTMHREVLLIPPDTALPKKKMTLKRLRKAQRLRDEVALGGKPSSERIWPVLQIETVKTLVQKAESVISSGADVTELLPISWFAEIVESSGISGSISSAHRMLINGRDREIVKYILCLERDVDNVYMQCDSMLDQEASWIRRWDKQVGMLRKGTV